MINPGNYKARAIRESVQQGENEKGNLQIFIDLDVFDGGESLGRMTTFLFFTENSHVYAFERLKALGWKGKSIEDIDNMDGIDANEVDVRVTRPEQYRAQDGTIKEGNSKIEIVTGGTVQMAKKVDPATFKARLRAIVGNSGGTAPSGGGGVAPPF